MDAELHFGQAEFGFLTIFSNTIATGERQLHTAAEAEASDQRHGGHIHGGETIKYGLTTADQIFGIFLAVHTRTKRGEFINICTSDEAARLAGGDYQSVRPLLLQSFEDLIKLLQDIGREGVGVGIGLIDVEPGDVVLVTLEAPVFIMYGCHG